MEQRRLRLGDIVDDYCPRERRLTNHAIVAMIDDDIKQTRCTTCDAEHPYKGGTAPRRRKKTAAEEVSPMPAITETEASLHPARAEAAPLADQEAAPAVPAAESDLEAEPEAEAPPVQPEEGPVHRPLIRATLPRPEGQKDVRPATEFTIRQPGTRSNGHFRTDQRAKHRAGGQGGNRPHGGPRFAGSRPGPQGRGAATRNQGGGFRSAQPQRRGGGRKRSR